MKRNPKIELCRNSIVNKEIPFGEGRWIIDLANNRIKPSSDLRWFNLYPYEDVKGGGSVLKIIGD